MWIDLFFNRKIVCEDHFTEQYFKNSVEHSLLGISCPVVKLRAPTSSHGHDRAPDSVKLSQSNAVTVKLAQAIASDVYYFAIILEWTTRLDTSSMDSICDGGGGCLSTSRRTSSYVITSDCY